MKAKGSLSLSISRPLMTRFVDVPMIVKHPPNILEKESGMRNCDGASFLDRAQSRVIGIRMKTIGVLLKTAENANVMNMSFTSATVLPESPNTFRAILSIRWLFSTPWAITNKLATVIILELEKPDRAWSVEMIPMSHTATSAVSMIMYAGASSKNSDRSIMNSTNTTTMLSHSAMLLDSSRRSSRCSTRNSLFSPLK